MLKLVSFLALVALAAVAQAQPKSCDNSAVADAVLPSGYCAYVWASGLNQPRAIDIAPNGDILIVEVGSGKISVNWEDVAGSLQTAVLYQNVNLSLTHHVKYWKNRILASSDTTVFQWIYTEDVYRKNLGEAMIAVSNLPESGHVARTVMLDAQDRLYINIGSGSNIDTDSSRARVVRSIQPFTGVQIKYPDDFEVFADGTRNEVGLRFDNQGRLWGVENGIDNIGADPQTRNDFGDIHLTNPGEEVNLFLEQDKGKFYGYPYCWSEGLGENGNKYSFPQGLGAGTQWATQLNVTWTDAWCRDTNNVITPKLIMQAHSAPLDILFYYGTTFPGMAGKAAFVAKHGSWDRPPENQSGRSVMLLNLDENGIPVSQSNFFSGPNGWIHRPVGLAVGKCASYGECLFVTDDSAGQIIAIAAGTGSTPPAADPTPAPTPVGYNEPRTIQLVAGLNLTYTLHPDNTITISLVKQDIQGWIAFGWNTQAGMLKTQAVIASGAGQSMGRFYVDSFDEEVIISTMNNNTLIPWTYTDASLAQSAAGSNLTYTRSLDGININQPVFIVTAWQVSKQANFSAFDLPKHTGAGSFSIVFATGHLGPLAPGSLDLPPSGARGAVPDPLMVSLILVASLVGLSVVTFIVSYFVCLRKKNQGYTPFVGTA